MAIEFDTFLVALYTIVDDLYRSFCAAYKPNRPGHKDEVSDSEVLVLMILAQWLNWPEREFVGHVSRHWRSYFPRMLDQSSFNRRVRDLAGVMVFLVLQVSEELNAALCAYQIFDGVPVPLMRCCRGRRHKLFDKDLASIGKGGSDRDWYYGCQLFLAVTPEGVITGFVLAPASTEGRWGAESFLCWRHNVDAEPWDVNDLPPSHDKGGGRKGPTGQIWPREAVGKKSLVPYVGDEGFKGKIWQSHWLADYQAAMITKDIYQGDEAKMARRRHSGWRQIVETVNAQLEQVFGLLFPRARTRQGLLARVAAKLLALNLGIWLNRHFDRPGLSFATLFNL